MLDVHAEAFAGEVHPQEVGDRLLVLDDDHEAFALIHRLILTVFACGACSGDVWERPAAEINVAIGPLAAAASARSRGGPITLPLSAPVMIV
nr:hypothetical protein GCM10020063_087040 [Dactylosporangium thailandense]